jgi:hypothetical protein
LEPRLPLRIGDAIQLASCLYLRDTADQSLGLVSFDDRLNTTARLEGMKLASGRTQQAADAANGR